MKKKIPTYCDQCYNGPDLFRAVVENGIVRSVEPNPDCKDISPAEGKICVKAYGLVQKLYNPDRIKSPLIRTNPEKGKDKDPGWKEITWDEAFKILSDKMKTARKKETVVRKSGSCYPALGKGANLCTETGKESTLFPCRDIFWRGRLW